MAEAEGTTQIDKHADVEGKLNGKDAKILGHFRGELKLTGRLVIGDEAKVEANITADAAEIAGQFKGDLVVRNLVLLEKARVEGTMDAQVLSVREGAQLNATVTAGSRGGANKPPVAAAK
jgi:cytoskeletal protein CcmA (bactofilin family)